MNKETKTAIELDLKNMSGHMSADLTLLDENGNISVMANATPATDLEGRQPNGFYVPLTDAEWKSVDNLMERRGYIPVSTDRDPESCSVRYMQKQED